MPRILLIVVASAALWVSMTHEVGAQGFGSSSLTPQASPGGGLFGGPTPAPGVAAAPGTASIPTSVNPSGPLPRFMRKGRTPTSFVGKSPTTSGKFVGSIQGMGSMGTRPAAADAVERVVPEAVLNPPRNPAVRTRMYEPRLYVGFQANARSDSDVNSNLQRQVNSLSQRDPSLRVMTIVEGETAHLVGEVGSEEERSLIEQMMLFEPGISSVQNDLRVTSVSP